MEPAEFLVQCRMLIDDEKTGDVLNLLQDAKFNEISVDVGWELVGILCKQLTKYEDEERLVDIEKCLLELLQRCSPKEVMLGLSEHLAGEPSIKSFIITMRLCKLTFVRLERRQSKYIISLCDHFISKIKYLLEDASENTSDMAEEDFLTIRFVLDFLLASVDFITGLVKHIGRAKSNVLESFLCESSCGKSWATFEITSCREAVVNFIFDILDVCAKTKIYEIILYEHRDAISDLVLSTFIFISFPDLLTYLMFKGVKSCNHVGIVIFFNLLLVHNMALAQIPKMYSCCYWFTNLCPFINVALKLTASTITTATLDLLSRMFLKWEMVFENSNLKSLQTMSISLTNIMIWCEEQCLRKQSEKLFLTLLQYLKMDLRLSLLQYVYKQSSHPGVLGYLINQINKTLDSSVSCGDECIIDVGELALLFTKIVVGENNVLHESDRYMAGLNFCRFWLLRDGKRANKIGIWRKVDDLNKNLSVMKNCIDLSKCEFEKQLKHLTHRNKNSEDDFHTELLLSLPGGEVFPELSMDEKVMTVNKALLTLDTMSSVVARIEEICSQKISS